MGVTIHYRGKLNRLEDFDALCEELIDIAESISCCWTRIDDDWSVEPDARLVHREEGAEIVGELALRGVNIEMKGDCESLSFFFDATGELYDPITRIMILEGTLTKKHNWVSVKTQFAPLAVHIWIVKLLRYLQNKYMANLEVNDEGEYWETSDVETLKQKIDFLNEKMDSIASQLMSVDAHEFANLSVHEMADRLEEIFKKIMHRDQEDTP
jgi:hypothetical protein